MGLRFVVRGTQLNAWYATFGATAGKFSNLGPGADDPVVTSSAGTGVFGGSVINMTPASVVKGLTYPGGLNVCAAGAGGAFSVLVRLLPRNTSTTSQFGIIESGNARGGYGNGFRCYLSSGRPGIQLDDGAGNLSTVTSAKTISTIANTALDVMFSWDGTTNANAVIISVNGVAFDTLTAPTANTFRDWTNVNSIITGSISSVGAQDMDLNELVVWDSVQSTVYATRTGFWPVSAFDGSVSTDPGVANVRSGTAYETAGVNYTGTLAVPVAADVRLGAAVAAGTGLLVVPSLANTKIGIAGDGGTGTYDGTDRNSDPGIANVVAPVAYKSNSTTNNRVGTYVTPPASTDPGVANVRLGTAYAIAGAAKTGTLDLPATADVRAGVLYDGGTKDGTLGDVSALGPGIIKSLLT